MVNTRKPDAVIFDWDNTLVDTWPIIHAALAKTFEAFNMPPWPMEKVMSDVKKSMRDSFPELFGEGWQRAGDIYQEAYRSSAPTHLLPLEGSEASLQLLAARQVPLFVVSNKKGDNLRAELKHLGWDHYFKAVVGAGDALKDKPFADPVWNALKPHGFETTDNIWFVGDSDVDLECAAITGCRAILYGLHPLSMPGYTTTALNGFPYHHHAKAHSDFQALVDF